MARKFKIAANPNKPQGINQTDFNDITKLQAFNNGQIYSKGFVFTTQANASNIFPIQLGGKPRVMHGIIFQCPVGNVTDDDVISLTINSEVVIDKVNWKAYLPTQNPTKAQQFYPIPRGLSGSDSVELTVTSVNSHTIFPIFYLSNA